MTDVLKNEVRHDMRQCYKRVHPDFMRLYSHFAPSYLARMRQVSWQTTLSPFMNILRAV